MSAPCQQKLCQNWSGDGGVCPCDLLELDRHCLHETFIEDEWGHRLCVRCDHEWWEDPL